MQNTVKNSKLTMHDCVLGISGLIQLDWYNAKDCQLVDSCMKVPQRLYTMPKMQVISFRHMRLCSLPTTVTVRTLDLCDTALDGPEFSLVLGTGRQSSFRLDLRHVHEVHLPSNTSQFCDFFKMPCNFVAPPTSPAGWKNICGLPEGFFVASYVSDEGKVCDIFSQRRELPCEPY